MTEIDRIARFKSMTEADPGNELGFFSLGRAYLDAGQPAEAIPALQRVLALNASFSKAYSLLGAAQRATGDEKGAVQTLTQGYRIAHDKGDLLLRNDMAMQLKEIGAPVPEIKTEELTPEAISAGKIKCSRCGRIALKMSERPFSDAIGGHIHNTVCGPCFREWLDQGTKVINELRLNLTEKRAQDIYDQHMKEFLNINPP
ncbi:MAG: Fe(2+)-trafficking protein [Phycisphaerales bacterium]|nr:Fe(2+)-trafficking protein [Phycisphaerales bacterium]